MSERKYTLLWIPRSGLFSAGGRFQDGDGQEIEWDRTLRIFASHARAEIAKENILAQYPNAKGELMVISVTVEEVAE